MANIEKYEELRGELSKMFLEGANLMNEDGFTLDLLSESLNHKEVLKISKFKEESDKIDMWNLSLRILQNKSACFSRLKEF
ncbi:hypothetical protein RDABS01_002188 [Bienertia sinuspersici]